jgi:hypothetical protein
MMRRNKTRIANIYKIYNDLNEAHPQRQTSKDFYIFRTYVQRWGTHGTFLVADNEVDVKLHIYTLENEFNFFLSATLFNENHITIIKENGYFAKKKYESKTFYVYLSKLIKLLSSTNYEIK